MARSRLPLAILGGSDLRPGELPPGATQRPLAAYKGAMLQVGGHSLIEEVVERFRATGEFGPITIAGPGHVYGGLVPDVEVVDTDADVATNLRVVVDRFLATRAEGPLALVSCDVLPSVQELRDLAREYREGGPCALWFPLVRAPVDPRELGAFAWKPGYELLEEPTAPPVKVLPGHLGVFDPRALRLALVYRLMDAAYRTRNKPVEVRRRAMLRRALMGLVRQDLLHLADLRLPNLTWSVVLNGLGIANKLRTRELTRGDLEHHVGRIVVSRKWRRRHGDAGRVRLPFVDTLTLAEDVDTDEEARAVGARLLRTTRP